MVLRATPERRDSSSAGSPARRRSSFRFIGAQSIAQKCAVKLAERGDPPLTGHLGQLQGGARRLLAGGGRADVRGGVVALDGDLPDGQLRILHAREPLLERDLAGQTGGADLLDQPRGQQIAQPLVVLGRGGIAEGLDGGPYLLLVGRPAAAGAERQGGGDERDERAAHGAEHRMACMSTVIGSWL